MTRGAADNYPAELKRSFTLRIRTVRLTYIQRDYNT